MIYVDQFASNFDAQHQYATTGTYTVALTGTDRSSGNVTRQITMVVSPTTHIVQSAGWITPPVVGQPATLRVVLSSPVRGRLSTVWGFDEGTTQVDFPAGDGQVIDITKVWGGPADTYFPSRMYVLRSDDADYDESVFLPTLVAGNPAPTLNLERLAGDPGVPDLAAADLRRPRRRHGHRHRRLGRRQHHRHDDARARAPGPDAGSHVRRRGGLRGRGRGGRPGRQHHPPDDEGGHRRPTADPRRADAARRTRGCAEHGHRHRRRPRRRAGPAAGRLGRRHHDHLVLFIRPGPVTATHTYVDNGRYPVSVVALDADDQESAARTDTARVRNAPPSLTLSAPDRHPPRGRRSRPSRSRWPTPGRPTPAPSASRGATGSPATDLTWTAGERTLSATHTYVDDDPTGTPVRPAHPRRSPRPTTTTAPAPARAGDHIRNVAPVVTRNLLLNAAGTLVWRRRWAPTGSTVTAEVTITDVGLADTHDALVDGGDGTTTPETVVAGYLRSHPHLRGPGRAPGQRRGHRRRRRGH